MHKMSSHSSGDYCGDSELMKATSNPPRLEDGTTTSVEGDNDLEKEEKESAQVALPKLQIRHDWYQTDSNVVVSILLKNLHVKGVDVCIEESSVEFSVEKEDGGGGRNLLLRVDLSQPVVPSLSSWKQTPSKVEIKLAKSSGGLWKTLEKPPITTSEGSSEKAALASESKLDYPSSSISRRNWDKIAVDIDRVEEEEAKAMSGEASVNKLFQQIYTGGSDEVRRAMNKSFMESGGTVLSTNWNEVEKSEVQVKPPDGMEFKKWDQ